MGPGARAARPVHWKGQEMRKRLDAEAVLRQLAEIRKSMPRLESSRPATSEGRAPSVGGIQPQTAEDFEELAVADALESLASELSAAVEQAYAETMETAMRAYYIAEEMAKDPAHAELIPHVEKMREAYLKSYGKPIPPKPKRD